MSRRAIYQRKVDGKWVVIELPADYHEGDRLPVRDSRDPEFDSREDAQAEVLRRAADDQVRITTRGGFVSPNRSAIGDTRAATVHGASACLPRRACVLDDEG